MPTMDGLFDWMWQLVIASLIVPLVITVLVLIVVVWAVRRAIVPREDPAVAELKERFARGEIDTAEFEVRLRALTTDRG